jgi:hypothetical protein
MILTFKEPTHDLSLRSTNAAMLRVFPASRVVASAKKSQFDMKWNAHQATVRICGCMAASAHMACRYQRISHP